ncbi:ABC transporter ATP-binding protein [Alicyclobacillus sp. ALC3]|uniref:ABC transporter ATP-binding protein n=1 Tax=Alicyclobacillus sp. ALC3 TaxID=2796143 RepID=UPI002379347A|nr:ABC transporter ATP-binding protein [Alicyclobacillus sp. ALC3]WDL98251.1 ABC transporter ATP-binding protein [Alicyclobacillus sp. ALC3]
MTPLLELDHVAADIGQFHILHDISLQVPEGGVTVLLGRNGAGKTSTLRTLMGFLATRSGEIRFAGRQIEDLPTHHRAKLGIAYVPEDGNIFAPLSVADNLRLSMPAQKPRTSDAQGVLERTLAVFPDLRAAWTRPAGTLSGGQRQMLAMACALVQEPACLVVDEPSKGLSPLFVERLGEVFEDLRGATTILLVEQNFYLASRVGQTFVLIDDGETVAAGSMADLVQSDELKARYLGVQVTAKGENP